MSVNPLDLQVNLGQINKVGKQQSLAKEHEVLRQEQAAEHLLKAGGKNADDVPETKKLTDDSGKIKNEKEKNSGEQETPEEKNKQEQKEGDNPPGIKKHTKAVNIDPDIGRSIDIVG